MNTGSDLGDCGDGVNHGRGWYKAPPGQRGSARRKIYDS